MPTHPAREIIEVLGLDDWVKDGGSTGVTGCEKLWETDGPMAAAEDAGINPVAGKKMRQRCRLHGLITHWALSGVTIIHIGRHRLQNAGKQGSGTW